ncbi:MAG TPA: hypothetical protein VGH84_02715 [Steroidobacteraceae bacterium]|jgi:hypothetical protein
MTQPLYEHFDPATQRATEVTVDADTGHLVFVHSQATRAIVENCKTIASNFDPLVRRDTVHVARIPLVIWQQLQRLGITRDEKALNRWLNGRDQRVFRTDGGSKL